MTCSTSWAPATPFIHLSQLVQGRNRGLERLSSVSIQQASYCSSNCRNGSCWFWYMPSTSTAQSDGHQNRTTGLLHHVAGWDSVHGFPGNTWHQDTLREKGKLAEAVWRFGRCYAGELWVLPSTAPFPLLTTQINSPWLATIQINGFSITINHHLMCMVVVIATHVPWYN